MSAHASSPAAAPLLRDADRLLACIHCGFCLSACPTFTRLGLEGDSPRGRLDLMRAVVEGRIDAGDEAFTLHIDRCLGCRACETACPAGVQYGFLLERSRAAIANARGHRFATRVLLTVFGNRTLARIAGALGRAFLATGLVPALVRIVPRGLGTARFGLAMLGATRPWRGLRDARAPQAPYDAAAERAAHPEPATTAMVSAEREVAEHPAVADGVDPHVNVPPDHRSKSGVLPEANNVVLSAEAHAPRSVALLDGCAQEALFARVNRATARVLATNDCALRDAPGQRCCGALHAHSGRLDDARDLARANIEAFERSGADAIVVNAAGCGAMMKEYGELLKDDAAWSERAHAMADRVRDLFEYLAALPPRRGAPLPARAAYDAPCHQYHAQRVTSAPLDVLAAVPQLETVPIAAFEDCCGGAGIYALEHPELGGRIVADKLDACRAAHADVVVTANPGCIMQIGGGFLLAGESVPVIHPIELLDESYRRAGYYDG